MVLSMKMIISSKKSPLFGLNRIGMKLKGKIMVTAANNSSCYQCIVLDNWLQSIVD